MNKSENIGKLAEALSKAQSEMTAALKDSNNPFFNSKYADLTSVWSAVREPFANNGLAVAQTSKVSEPVYHDPDGNGKSVMHIFATIETTLMHSSGEWISGECSAPIVKKDPQGIGSAITYLRRYGLSAIAGVVQDDDDGNAASGGNAPNQQRNQQRPPAQAKAPAPAKQQAPAPGTATAKGLTKAQIFGSGAAKDHEPEISAVFGELNKLGANPAWQPSVISDYCQEQFDKTLSQMDEEEINVLIADFTEQLKEERAVREEGNTPSHTGVTPAPAPAPVTQVAEGSVMATDKQISVLRKLCEIKSLEEAKIMHESTNGVSNSFDQLAEADAARLIKEMQSK